jgi:hypothetical protein
MRAPRIVALLAVAGALGASACAAFLSDFSTGERADGGEPDALPATDGERADGGEPDALAVTDAVTADAVDSGEPVMDTGPDGVVPSDGGPGLGDAAEAGCEPIPAATITCGGAGNGGPSYATPGFFCGTNYTSNQYFLGATPSECQCAGQFTCACLMASSYVPLLPWCVGGPYPAGSYPASGCLCQDTVNGPQVSCDDAFVPGSGGQRACGS